MAEQDLLAMFLVATAVAVLIQTGILVGVYYASAKLSRQAERAMELTRNSFGPLEATATSLQKTSARLAEFSASVQSQLRQFESWRRRGAA
jgi:hypothetical protein